jgi:hypothetical protein
VQHLNRILTASARLPCSLPMTIHWTRVAAQRCCRDLTLTEAGTNRAFDRRPISQPDRPDLFKYHLAVGTAKHVQRQDVLASLVIPHVLPSRVYANPLRNYVRLDWRFLPMRPACRIDAGSVPMSGNEPRSASIPRVRINARIRRDHDPASADLVARRRRARFLGSMIAITAKMVVATRTMAPPDGTSA